MSKAIVENTPFAVLAGPDDREVFVLTMDALPGQIDFVGIETQQYTHVGAREILDLHQSESARVVMHRHAPHTRYIDVNDAGVIRDVDDPEAYREILDAAVSEEAL